MVIGQSWAGDPAGNNPSDPRDIQSELQTVHGSEIINHSGTRAWRLRRVTGERKRPAASTMKRPASHWSVANLFHESSGGSVSISVTSTSLISTSETSFSVNYKLPSRPTLPLYLPPPSSIQEP